MISQISLVEDNIDTRLNNLSGIKLREINWGVQTAGPSPFNNERVELFFLGCKKAKEGKPCKGCFNSSTWDDSNVKWTHDPILMAKHINNISKNKYITIGGGEPFDQFKNLSILCRELKKYGFHIMVYTHYKLQKLLKNRVLVYGSKKSKIEFLKQHNIRYDVLRLLTHIDILVDGEFKIKEKLWDGNKKDGLLSSVGSGNQIIWDINNKFGYAMKDLNSLSLDENNILKFGLKDDAVKHIL